MRIKPEDITIHTGRIALNDGKFWYWALILGGACSVSTGPNEHLVVVPLDDIKGQPFEPHNKALLAVLNRGGKPTKSRHVLVGPRLTEAEVRELEHTNHGAIQAS